MSFLSPVGFKKMSALAIPSNKLLLWVALKTQFWLSSQNLPWTTLTSAHGMHLFFGMGLYLVDLAKPLPADDLMVSLYS